MNPIVISTIIGGASFILTTFFAIYLNQRRVDKLIEQMDKKFEARTNEASARLEAIIDVLQSEFQALRMETNARFDYVQRKSAALQSKVDRIEQALFRSVLPPRV